MSNPIECPNCGFLANLLEKDIGFDIKRPAYHCKVCKLVFGLDEWKENLDRSIIEAEIKE